MVCLSIDFIGGAGHYSVTGYRHKTYKTFSSSVNLASMLRGFIRDSNYSNLHIRNLPEITHSLLIWVKESLSGIRPYFGLGKDLNQQCRNESFHNLLPKQRQHMVAP